jgi:aryl-alcohol dehydrogenase-like predicted oxidoreductase
MNKLALGTAQFGLNYGVANYDGQVKLGEVKSILKCAKKNRINTLDTASVYGNSEKALGMAGVNDFLVVTKTSQFANNTNEVIKNFHQSLVNLKKSNVDGLLIHNINEVSHKQFSDLFNKVLELKRQGLVNKIGFSTYTPEQVDFLLENFDFDLIQVPFNILDHRLMQGGQLNVLKNKGIEVHARSVFLQGVLLLSKQNRPNNFKLWDALWKIWHEWLNDNQITALEATIRYAISIPEISKVLVGVDSEKQLKEILNVSSGDLPEMPSELFTDDVDLLNPSNWGGL